MPRKGLRLLQTIAKSLTRPQQAHADYAIRIKGRSIKAAHNRVRHIHFEIKIKKLCRIIIMYNPTKQYII